MNKAEGQQNYYQVNQMGKENQILKANGLNLIPKAFKRALHLLNSPNSHKEQQTLEAYHL